MIPLLAQISFGSMSVVQLAIAVVVIVGIVALVVIAIRQMGVTIPAWVVQALWVVAIVVVIVFLIKVLAGVF